MKSYTNAELPDMHLGYESSDCNGHTTKRLHTEWYSKRQTPSHAFFAVLLQRLSEYGSFIMDTQELE
ncbi:hypothetical protein TNCV_855091 [Trichonephila clavipes]|nr:hypothetical protein TNCV_855091 [Trichonephila clavipes]